jgi:hypothetical protein
MLGVVARGGQSQPILPADGENPVPLPAARPIPAVRQKSGKGQAKNAWRSQVARNAC